MVLSSCPGDRVAKSKVEVESPAAQPYEHRTSFAAAERRAGCLSFQAETKRR
jgi:hypothetical protein